MPTSEQNGLRAVLEEAWRYGISLQGDFFRSYPAFVGMAASLGLITTKEQPGLFGHRWRVSHKGLKRLNELKETKWTQRK